MYTLKRISSNLTALVMMVLLLALTTNAQEKPDTSKTGHKMHQNMNMNHSNTDSTHHSKMMNHNMMDSTKHSKMNHRMMDSSKMMNHKASIVREEPIDLQAIDANGDGKVFQDQMDWNVISDEAGECPLCGMKLKEVKLDEAKTKLIEKGFKVK